ncbi:hypothetical protein [Streptomyces longisporus]|uniref:Uncharacterized protein n=1 Tax=Streptomyces longisporus TaxID=1948 RepID=A0ABP5Z815_STRLO
MATAHGGTVTLDLPCLTRASRGVNGMERSRRGIVSDVTGQYLPWLGVPLEHGPWAAALEMPAVTPGGLWVLALMLERRLMGFRTGFVAALVGDPLLAVAVALGVWRMGTTPPAGPSGLWRGLASGVGWLVFGLVQWWAELRSGFFTRQQAVAPPRSGISQPSTPCSATGRGRSRSAVFGRPEDPPSM